MLFTYGRKIISETAAADLMDPEVSTEVKDVVNDLEDVLTTNVEEVPAEDKETNNAVLTAEACTVFEASLGGGKYAVDVRDIIRICEAEEEETGTAPDAAQVADDVAAANDVPKDELVIVCPADTAEEIVTNAVQEAKCGKKGKCFKKAKGLGDAIKSLKAAGKKIVVKGKKKK